jgi:pimeloyl-ACP methyl ester carboxylesterase
MTRSAHTSAAPAANPTTLLYANPVAQGLGLALRGLQHRAPRLGTRLALRLFFTPLPSKLAARRGTVPAPWQMERWPFERETLVAYRRRDVAPGAPRVLLVHGWAGDAMQMRPLADTLAAAGFDPVLLDFPGHGRSSGWRSSLPQFVRGVWAASSRLGPLHAVVAHSMGALAATHAVARGLPVQHLALVSPSPAPSVVLHWFARGFGLSEALSSRMRGGIERNEGMPLDEFELGWLAPRVTQPTLVVHDEGDRIAPFAVGQAMAQRLPQARLASTQGLGHRRVLSDAATHAAVLGHLVEKG